MSHPDTVAMTRPSPQRSPQEVYISFTGDTNQAALDQLIRTCSHAAAMGTERLTLLLNCPGGSSVAGMGGYNMLRALPLRLTTVNMFLCASTGLTLFLAGERRLAVPNATFGLHPAVMPLASRTDRPAWTAAQLREAADFTDLHTKLGVDVVFDRCRFPSREAAAGAHVGEVIRDAAFGLEHGLIHEITEFSIPKGGHVVTIGIAR